MSNFQTLFDKAVKGVIAQGVKAVDPTQDRCVYRGPNNTKCAVGQLIPDDKYHRTFDGPDVALPTADSLTSERLRLAIGIEGGPSAPEAQFLSSLQGAHDRSNQDEFLSDFKHFAANVADDYGLNKDVLDAPAN